jgi:hypothetical protein
MKPTERNIPGEDPEAQLENTLIDEFLRANGVDPSALRELPEDEAKRILAEASTYAATKLAEVESRAHFIHEIHGKE